MKKLGLFIVISLSLLSCSTQKNVSQPKEIQTDTTTKSNLFFSNILKKSEFNVLKINSKIDVEIGKFIPTINATIYIENGQKVWMNMSALFMNIGRGIATPQGLKAYERIDKTYIDSDFSYLNQLLNVNFLDYQALQNLLVGKVFVPIQQDNFKLSSENNGYTLKSINSQKIKVEEKESEYLTDFKFSSNFDLTEMTIKDIKSNDQLHIFYENWEDINGNRLPKNVKIIIKGKKTGQILIENTNFDFSKMETPYKVPNNYKKRELQ